MKRILLIGVALAVSLTACGGSSNTSASERATQRQANLYAIDQIERTWHKASSTHDVDLMMTLWAPDATFNIGTETLTAKAQIQDFSPHTPAPFRPGNHWAAEP